MSKGWEGFKARGLPRGAWKAANGVRVRTIDATRGPPVTLPLILGASRLRWRGWSNAERSCSCSVPSLHRDTGNGVGEDLHVSNGPPDWCAWSRDAIAKLDNRPDRHANNFFVSWCHRLSGFDSKTGYLATLARGPRPPPADCRAQATKSLLKLPALELVGPGNGGDASPGTLLCLYLVESTEQLE